MDTLNQERKEACSEYLADHYDHFGAWPMDFEFNDEVFDYETYMSWFTDSELSEISHSKTNL